MKTQILIILGTLFFSNPTFSQVKPFINFDDCTSEMMFATVEKPASWNPDTIPFKQYFEKMLMASVLMKKLSGKVMLSIIVSEQGEPCLKGFMDSDNAGFVPEEFRLAVKQMPKWNPALQDGKPVTYIKTAMLKIQSGKVL